MAAPDEFYTVVRNRTANAITLCLPFPPYTVSLTANNTTGCDFVFRGDLFAKLSMFPRFNDSFNTLRNAGTIVIIQTPLMARWDTSAGRVREVEVSGGSMSVVDPAFSSYFGTAPTL